MTTHSQTSTSPRTTWTRRHLGAAVGQESATTDRSGPNKAMIATIAAALITAVSGTVTAVILDSGDMHSTPITEVQPSERVSVDNAKLSDSRTALALWGTANPYVEQVRVTVSAPNAKEAIFDDVTNVTDGKWSLVATSDRQIPEPYEVMAFDKRPTFTSSGVHKTSRMTFKLDPPTPTTQPGQDSVCPPQSIGGCFADPNWGPPAIYRSE